MYGSIKEVLVLNNVTMNMEGMYSCVDGDNAVMSAQLNVLGELFFILFPAPCIC